MDDEAAGIKSNLNFKILNVLLPKLQTTRQRDAKTELGYYALQKNYA